MGATCHQSRTQASGSSARAEANMNQIGPPSAIQGKDLYHGLRASIGSIKDQADLGVLLQSGQH